MNGTIIQQGSFISSGEPYLVNLRSDVDWMMVTNYSAAGAQNMDDGVQFYWQRGMVSSANLTPGTIPAQTGDVFYRPAASNALAVTTANTLNAGNGVSTFQLVNTSTAIEGPLTALTQIDNTGAGGTVSVQVASTAGMNPATQLVEIINVTGGGQYNGLVANFSVIDATHFGLALPGPAAPTGTGFFRLIPGYFDQNANPVSSAFWVNTQFNPQVAQIADITQANQAIVNLLTAPAFQTGELVRFSVPAEFGMSQIDGLVGTVTYVASNAFTVNINTTGFTAFTWPTAAAFQGQFPSVTPFAQNPQATSLSPSAVENIGFIGMLLYPGQQGPAGQNTNVMYWLAGKSWNL